MVGDFLEKNRNLLKVFFKNSFMLKDKSLFLLYGLSIYLQTTLISFYNRINYEF